MRIRYGQKRRHRKNRKAYELFTAGKILLIPLPNAIKANGQDLGDDAVKAGVIATKEGRRYRDGDNLIFVSFREDSVRQLAQSKTDEA